MENVNRIVAEGIAAIEAAQDFNALEQIKARYLGKTGELTGLLKTLGQMSPEERKTIGAHINECKNQFQTAFNSKRDALNEAKLQAQLAAEALDITLPGRAQEHGGLHPVTLTLQRVVELFHGMGFEVADGPEIRRRFPQFPSLEYSCKSPHVRCKIPSIVENGERFYVQHTFTYSNPHICSTKKSRLSALLLPAAFTVWTVMPLTRLCSIRPKVCGWKRVSLLPT